MSEERLPPFSWGQELLGRPQPDAKLSYKTVPDWDLSLHAFWPEGHDPTKDRRPAIVFFFGGGWKKGSPVQFYSHCRLLAEHGMIGLSAEYRVSAYFGTGPETCITDGKSAIRWVRQHAGELGIDPSRIAAGGGSAGGHVAAASAACKAYDDPADDRTVSCRPDALCLFNPVFDNGSTGYGKDRLTGDWQDFSPLHNLHAAMPPTVTFLGREDHLVPVATAEDFHAQLTGFGVANELHLYPGQGHGFFNYARGDGTSYADTTARMVDFLRQHGFITDRT